MQKGYEDFKMNTEEVKTKKCGKCGRELPVDNFSKDKTKKDGLQSWCRECKNKHNKTYKQTHRQYLNQYRNQYNKQYYDRFKGYYLYIILDKQDNVAYIGQTTNYYRRLTDHLYGGVNNATKELFANNEWACIKYLDVSNIVENDLELRAMDNILIELYNPKLNTLKNIIHDIDKGRLFSLIATLHSILNEWITFKTNV